MALVKTKNDSRAALKEAVQINPYPVDEDEPNGTQFMFRVGTGKKVEDLTESQFFREYSPFDHGDAKELRERPAVVSEE